MKLTDTPELLRFLSTQFGNTDADQDQETLEKFRSSCPPRSLEKITSELLTLLHSESLPLEEIGTETNRWFSTSEEAQEWLEKIRKLLQDSTEASRNLKVLDSNGTLLAEGDSVQVIKDLKVKGGSSDLKRGTLIKKIHLVDDPEVVECRVDGSTLVLKTCFLKKA